jgi:aspartate-semialdehyde dehydrogenase
MMKERRCAVLGGSGLIGQQFIRLLSNHPYLKLDGIYSSSRSAGKTVSQCWALPGYSYPLDYTNHKLQDLRNIKNEYDIVFSGLPATVAKETEPQLRDKGIAVFSNASAFRMENNVPILIPEVNASHLNLIKYQQQENSSNGFIVTNANCTVTGAAIYLHELIKIVPLRTAVVTSYQALSGAGLSGVTALDINNNVIPYIPGEEEKVRIEGQKILGHLHDDKVKPSVISIIANCARVPVIDGHLEAITVFIDPESEVTEERILEKLAEIQSPIFDNSKYVLAPSKHLLLSEESDRPQPRLDAYAGSPRTAKGMAVSVGRIRKEGSTIRAYVLSHNTIRGGAGGSVLNAEYACNLGFV